MKFPLSKIALALFLLGSTAAHAVTQAELDAMMSNVRSIVTNIGTPDEVQRFDNQMDESRRLREQSAATQADTARVRAATMEAQAESERQNAKARFEEQSRIAQQKQDDLNRSPPRSSSQISQHRRDECPSCR